MLEQQGREEEKIKKCMDFFELEEDEKGSQEYNVPLIFGTSNTQEEEAKKRLLQFPFVAAAPSGNNVDAEIPI